MAGCTDRIPPRSEESEDERPAGRLDGLTDRFWILLVFYYCCKIRWDRWKKKQNGEKKPPPTNAGLLVCPEHRSNNGSSSSRPPNCIPSQNQKHSSPVGVYGRGPKSPSDSIRPPPPIRSDNGKSLRQNPFPLERKHRKRNDVPSFLRAYPCFGIKFYHVAFNKPPNTLT